MALTESKVTSQLFPLGSIAPDFSLPGVDGQTYSLESFHDCKALLIVFMCNHCPYVIAVQDRINALAKEWQPKGLGVIGINSNDPIQYPEDSFEAMQVRSKELEFVFAYVQDRQQTTARAYDAACTPDPYLFQKSDDGDFILRYHGRIDDSWKDERQVKQRDLHDAIRIVIEGSPTEIEHLTKAKQIPAMGCNIKWIRK